jgi:hypothetical protein
MPQAAPMLRDPELAENDGAGELPSLTVQTGQASRRQAISQNMYS